MRPVHSLKVIFRKVTAAALSFCLTFSSVSPAFAGRLPGKPFIKAQTFRAVPSGEASSFLKPQLPPAGFSLAVHGIERKAQAVSKILDQGPGPDSSGEKDSQSSDQAFAALGGSDEKKSGPAVPAGAGAHVPAGLGSGSAASASGIGKPLFLDSPEDEETFGKINRDLGLIVEESEAPLLYKTLRRTFDRLSRAQQGLFPSDVLVLNRVFLVDSRLVNAFVVLRLETGVRRINNLVFVTTALLKNIFEDRSGKSLRGGMAGLAGILAHELAHPVERLDEKGITLNYGARVGSQAVETRADADGMAIAKKAGYPADSVYEGLKRLFKDGRRGSGLLGAALSTHPQHDLRLSTQRMLLTLDRYRKGRHSPEFPESLSQSFLKELDSLEKARSLWKFKEPASLLEAFDRIQKVSGLDQGQEYKLVEFNRLVLFIDRLLSRRKEPLSREEFKEFKRFNLFLADTEKQYPYELRLFDREGMNSHFTRETESLEFLNDPPHLEFIKRIPACRSMEYLDWVKSRFFTRPGSDFKYLQESFRALMKILPADLLFEHFGDKIAQALLETIKDELLGRSSYEKILRLDGPGALAASVEHHVRMAFLFHQKVLPYMDEKTKLDFIVGAPYGRFSYVFPTLDMDPERRKNRGRGVLSVRQDLMADPGKKEPQEMARKVFLSIWENRGYYGMLDLFPKSSYRTDWEMIFEVLGIEKNTGYSKLRKAVKEFAASGAYADLLRVLPESKVEEIADVRHWGNLGAEENLDWLDDSLFPAVSGELNPRVKSDSTLQDYAVGLLSRLYLSRRKGLFRVIYGKRLREALGRESLVSPERLKAIHEEILRKTAGPGSVVEPLQDVLAAEIDRSVLSRENKKELLRAVFVEGHGREGSSPGLFWEERGQWLRGDEPSSNGTVLKVLLGNGALTSVQEFFGALLRDESYLKSARREAFSNFFLGVVSFKGELIRELEEEFSVLRTDRRKFACLLEFAREILDPDHGRYKDSRAFDQRNKLQASNSKEVREIKARLIQLAYPLKASEEENFRLFYRLTGGGATRDTDEFFKKRLYGLRLMPFDSKSRKRLELVLENKRIQSHGLQLDLAKKLLEPWIGNLEPGFAGPAALYSLVEKINSLIPSGSLQKDEWLEEIAWRLNLGGKELSSLIEDEKSYNWRKANPLLINLGSVLSEELSHSGPRARLELLEFVLDPGRRELPGRIVRSVERAFYQKGLEAARTGGKRYRDKSTAADEIRREAREAAFNLKQAAEAALRDATPYERIPLLEQIIASGSRSLAREPDYPYNLTGPFLKYKSGSVEEKLLLAFLSVIPEHERSVSLAYLLSQAGENKSSLKNIFEVFQTVGIKFGQLSSTWRIFGEEAAKETVSLKTDAQPMTKAEILKVLEKELSPEELSKIKNLKKILGSASLKTVVLIELQDGRKVVAMVQRPHAAGQIESNLSLSAEFLREIKSRGIELGFGMFDPILKAVKNQLDREMEMTEEAEKIKEARAVYDGLNRSHRSSLKGWRFEVPGLIEGFKVRKNILFVELAKGATFDKLDPAAQKEAGPILAESALASLFQKGWFDADRHLGNQLIDSGRKVIYPIDFGQVEHFSRKGFWRSDDRYVLARFLGSVAMGEEEAVLKYGLKMAGKEDSEPEGLADEVLSVLSEKKDVPDRLISLANAFSEHGAPFEQKFSFGALKGLLTLYGERYVSDEDFGRLLRSEIEKILRKKFSLVFWEKMTNQANNW